MVSFTGIFFCFSREISCWRQIDSGAHPSRFLFLGQSSIPYHSHNALNLLSSATDKVNRGGRPPTRRKPAQAIDLRAGFDQAVENSNRPLQEGDTVMAHGDVCVLKEISKLEVLVCIMLACTWCGAWMSSQSFL